MLVKSLAMVSGLMLLGSAACGGTTDGTDSMNGGGPNGGAAGGPVSNVGGMSGGATGGAAGAMVSSGGTGAGGTNSSGAAGATTIMGGSGGTGAGGTNSSGGSSSTGGSGALGTPGYPSGPVSICFGSGCPLGDCDNDRFFSQTLCSSLYTADIGPNSSYCNAGETGAYCLYAAQAGSSFNFAVNCAGGTATVLKCKTGCTGGGACL